MIIVGLFGNYGDNEAWENLDAGTLTRTEEMPEDMQKRQLNRAQEIYVVIAKGYIGSGTQLEINYADAAYKPVC